MNTVALVIFAFFLAVTFIITSWAARRTGSANEFYAAAGKISAFQNGIALAGDYLSASAFLGLVAIFMTAGFDGLLYGLGGIAAWPMLLFLFADRMRKSGKYTFTDVLAARLNPIPIRIFSSVAGLTILLTYMIAQIVGAGSLVALLMNWSFPPAAALIGFLTIAYVAFGGMLATTWVQMIKAIALIMTCIGLTYLVFQRFDFSVHTLIDAAVAATDKGSGIFSPSSQFTSILGTISLGLSLLLGPAGLPHILMRFFTVPDDKSARNSAFYALLIIAAFNILMGIIGYGAIALLNGDASLFNDNGTLKGGANMAALHLASTLGGAALLGVVSAVVFATVLAVVAGMAISAAAMISHDLVAQVFARSISETREVFLSRIAVVLFVSTSVGLSILFSDQNVLFLGVMALSVSASTTFPVLFLSFFWPGLTTRGAIAGGVSGLISSVMGVMGSPAVWTSVLGFEAPLFSLHYPTVISLPLALSIAIVVSIVDRRRPLGAPA